MKVTKRETWGGHQGALGGPQEQQEEDWGTTRVGYRFGGCRVGGVVPPGRAQRPSPRSLSAAGAGGGGAGVAEGPSLPWHLLDGATFVLAAGSPPARWEEGSGLRRKRAVLAVLLHFLETYKGLLQEEESAGKVIKVRVPLPVSPPATSVPCSPGPDPSRPAGALPAHHEGLVPLPRAGGRDHQTAPARGDRGAQVRRGSGGPGGSLGVGGSRGGQRVLWSPGSLRDKRSPGRTGGC